MLGAATILAACTSTAKSGASKVGTDSEPLECPFAALGPLSEVHWLGVVRGTDSRVSVPGPADVRVVGLAKLRAGGATAIVGASQRDFQPATPSRLPETLAQFMPKSAKWVRSESFDREVTGGTYDGAFYFDPGTDRVYFDTTNPSTAASSDP
ncbi:hypothetical protein [Streptomyces brasiliensis]|uniref:Uncharacterized protein n=1 Tax=Streptomyces brasiliensis TaxID=1954 RepID=A0A917P5W3_9ACTN|nr:hypothetical protein [Streptomyces brasiliensis]GGJ63137.1 hypothetical protein GCM10010121_087290 [Streptomyces brasiliensis]